MENRINEGEIQLNIFEILYIFYGYKNKALEMDAIKPVLKEPLPAVLFTPGGGFISSNKTNFSNLAQI